MFEETAHSGASDSKGAANGAGAQRRDANEVDRSMLAVAAVIRGRRATLRAEFDRLAAQWREERNVFSSNPADWSMCLPYQRIIAMGPEAIPLILEELHKHPDHWFWALNVLTNENPVPRDKSGRFADMVQSWLSWGKSREFISPTLSQ